ncbi:hypothetical protein GCM10009555_093240 [Acrocarpospora macrocephala]|uniref:SsuA/THI5-like domain-containing protein n=1 Tax=Acrocarpospora macrocephala TaxID=150177 RepID=A0A5M3X002_9ACTN|nr:ABC transporter substrate-binding protein [Acrocarpospora macrocephala]GES13996.1 hypothetical protein Amac_075930 [Acrocarpospora macrocephala]
MISRALHGAVGLAVATALLTGCSAASSGREQVTFMMDVALLPKHALFYAAVDQGFYRAAGFDVMIVPGSGSKNTALAVASGRVSFGFADFGQTALARSQGAKVKQLGLVQARTAYATITTSDTGIRRWPDLKGKKVATEAGGAMAAMFPLARERAGLKESDVQLIAASGPAKIPGLLSGQWDATLAFYNSDQPVLVSLGYTPVMLKWSDLGISMYGNGIIAGDEAIAGDPDRVRRFVTATLRGVKWACDHQDQAGRSLLGHVRLMNQKAAQAGVASACDLVWSEETRARGLGVMTDAGVRHVLDLTGRYLKADTGGVRPADLYTDEFLAPIGPATVIDAPHN